MDQLNDQERFVIDSLETTISGIFNLEYPRLIVRITANCNPVEHGDGDMLCKRLTAELIASSSFPTQNEPGTQLLYDE